MPISVTLAVKQDGSFITPSAGSYYIENNSLVPIHVAEIKAELDSTNATGYSFSDSAVTNDTGKKIYLKMEQKESDTAAAGTSISMNNNITVANGSWNISAKSGDTGTKMGLHFEGGVTKDGVNPEWANNSAKLLTITYTIAAGSVTASN